MPSVPFALSIHSLVSSVGADAGFAAIIGLAILVLLYFAQARETASLREGLENADRWIEALESQLSQLERGQGPAGPQPAQPPFSGSPAAAVRQRPGQPAGAPAPAGARTGVPGGGRIPLTGAPAGMAAPALAAATTMIPQPGRGAVAAPAAQAGEDGLTQVDAPAVNAAGSSFAPAPEDTMLVAPAPSTAAAVANGRNQSGAAVASRPAAPPAAGPPPAPAPRPSSPSAAGALPLNARSGGSRQLPPLRGPGATTNRPSRARRLVPILVGLGAVVAIVVVLLIITGSGPSSTIVHNSAKVSARSKHGGGAAVDPAAVTVAVLNGTGVTNLAHDVANRLATDGYKNGAIATAADQTHTSTVVAYLAGHRSDARAVAAVLNLKRSAVQPVDQQAMGVACPGASTTSASSCAADVVVTVGNDLSGLAANPAG